MIVVTFAALQGAAADINSFTSGMRGELDGLESRIKSGLHEWDSDARAEYEIARGRWNQAASDITDILKMLSDGVLTSEEMMRVSEMRNTARF
jgi:WXG100 family type VII secretion target